MRATATVMVVPAVMLLGSCDSKTAAPGGGGGGAPAAQDKKAFLDATREVPPRKEWNKDVIAKNGGTISFRVTSQGPFAVTVVTDKGRQALLAGGKVDQAEMLLTQDYKTPVAEGKVKLPAGKSWFIIENQTDKPANVRLECFPEYCANGLGRFAVTLRAEASRRLRLTARRSH